MSELSTLVLLLELQRRVSAVYLGKDSDSTLSDLELTTFKQLHSSLKSSRDQLVKKAEEHEQETDH